LTTSAKPKDILPAPTGEQIEAARLAAGLTQQQAAELVHRKDSARWREWSSERHAIDPAVWELFLIKSGQRKVPRFAPQKGFHENGKPGNQ